MCRCRWTSPLFLTMKVRDQFSCPKKLINDSNLFKTGLTIVNKWWGVGKTWITVLLLTNGIWEWRAEMTQHEKKIPTQAHDWIQKQTMGLRTNLGDSDMVLRHQLTFGATLRFGNMSRGLHEWEFWRRSSVGKECKVSGAEQAGAGILTLISTL